MNLNLFLIILIALIIILLIILYNGIRLLLTVGKEKGMVKYEFKITLLKIPIFTRKGNKEIIDIILGEDSDEDLEENKKESESKEDEEKDKKSKSKDESNSKDDENPNEESESEEEEQGEEEEKGLMEKYKEIKPTLKKLWKSKEELKSFLNNLLKAIDIKKLQGNLIIGLSDHATTIKIASWIWSIGAIVNSNKATLLGVEPRFNEIIIDFEGKLELKINLLLAIFYILVLLTNRDIRELIKEFIWIVI